MMTRAAFINRILTTTLMAWTQVFVAAHAEVVRDGSIGPDSSTQASGPDYVIEQSMGETVGANLFHSFSTFNLNSTESATFTSAAPLDNVITRITGGGGSVLDGSLSSTIAGASLFFINPNGVVFGKNASLNVDGDFHVSSADYLRFDDESQFSVSIDGVSSILSSAPPVAFGFLGNHAPASISIDESKLSLKEQSQLSIIAGDISINSGTSAVISIPSGQLNLVSVAEGGEVPVAIDGDIPSVLTLGTVNLQGERIAEIENGDDDIDDAPDPLVVLSGDSGGRFVVRSSVLNIDNFSIATHNLGDTDAASVGIDLNVSGAITISGYSALSSTSEAAGKAGSVVVKAGMLTMRDDAEILSDTFSSAEGSEVRIDTDKILLYGDAELGSDVEGSGNGGEVNINTRILIVGGEAEISTDTSGTGNGGRVNISATESILLDQQGGVFSDTQTGARAGDITITTPYLKIRGFEAEDDDDDDGPDDDGDMDDDIFEAAGVYSISTSSGDAGNITITADKVEIRNEAAIAASAIGASGGNITINSTDELHIRGSAVIADVSDGVGGNITLNSEFVLLHGSEVVARAGAGQGGAIVIDAGDYFSSETTVSASAGPAGISGSVNIPTAIDLGASLSPPETSFNDNGVLLETECQVRGNIERQGSLVLVPRRINPTTVEGLLVQPDPKEELESIPLAPSLSDKEVMNDSLDDALQLSLRIRNGIAVDENLSRFQNIIQRQKEGAAKVYLLLHLANSLLQVRENALLESYTLIRQAEDIARALNDVRAMSFVLGNLAQLYLEENRTDEALVLTRQALGFAQGDAAAYDAEYRWHWLEGKLLWAQGKTGPAIAAYERAVNILSTSRLEGRVKSDGNEDFFQQEIYPVYLDLLEAQFATVDLLESKEQRLSILLSARGNVEKIKAAELRDYFDDPCITEVSSQATHLDELIESTAIFYPVVLRDRLELLVTLPGGLKRYTVAVSSDTLANEVDLFRSRLHKIDSLLYRRHAKRLYRWLIQPVLADLQAENVSTLVFVTDPVLRSLPMAALHDGAQFLIEQFALATAPSLDLVSPQALDKSHRRLLLAGISQSVQGFSALPNVEKELGFVENLLGSQNSQTLLNEQFVSSSVQQSLAKTHPRIVHIASHAEFGGRQQDDFVLTYDGRINISQLRQYIGVAKYRSEPLELLILSACETAAGDNRAALGLSGVAIQAGARSALGSLWRISDDAALDFMSTFYQELFKDESSKAGALQGAQLKLLKSADFNHPYYWSPYIIISNWF